MFDPTKRLHPGAAAVSAAREEFRKSLNPENPTSGFSGGTLPAPAPAPNPAQPQPTVLPTVVPFVPDTVVANPTVQPQPVLQSQQVPADTQPTVIVAPQPQPVLQPTPQPIPMPVAPTGLTAAELEVQARRYESDMLKEALQTEKAAMAAAAAEKKALEFEVQALRAEAIKSQAKAAFPKEAIALPANSIDPEDAAAIGTAVHQQMAEYLDSMLAPLQDRIKTQDQQLAQYAQNATQQDYKHQISTMNAALFAAIPNIKEWRDSTAWASVKHQETYPGSRETLEQAVDKHYINGNADGIINIFKTKVMPYQLTQPSLEDYAQVPATTFGTAPAPAESKTPGLLSPEELGTLMDLYQSRKISHEEFLAKRKAHREALAANSPS